MGIAIIGVIGTLAGTFLGWLLNSLSQKGKLNAYISSFEDSFKHNEIGCMVPSKSKEQSESYSYTLILDLYNASDKTKILRDITVVFSDGKHELYKSIPYDDRTERSSGPLRHYDKICPINVLPKNVIRLELHNGIWLKEKKFDFIWDTQKIYLTYIDEKNNLKKVPIRSEAYQDYFKNHKAEEE